MGAAGVCVRVCRFGASGRRQSRVMASGAPNEPIRWRCAANREVKVGMARSSRSPQFVSRPAFGERPALLGLPRPRSADPFLHVHDANHRAPATWENGNAPCSARWTGVSLETYIWRTPRVPVAAMLVLFCIFSFSVSRIPSTATTALSAGLYLQRRVWIISGQVT